MTKGVVIFAFDNETTQYTELAKWSATRIDQHLGLPVSLITNHELQGPHRFDQVILIDRPPANGTRAGTWYNRSRYRAHELSPYHQTVLLDADYVVASDQILALFDVDQPILSMRWAFDCTGRRDYHDLNFFGRNNMPSAWATILYWTRSKEADMVFGMMQMIEQDWDHYKNIYGITERKFRNDYALAIALNTVMGHTGTWPEIPWALATVEDDVAIKMLSHDEFELEYSDSGTKNKKNIVRGIDLHVMNKAQLGEIIGSHL